MMMAGKKRCVCCGAMFVPDRRVGVRQKTCSAACRKARKRENNKSFSRKNPEYWRGRYEDVKAWRAKHPGYQKQWRQRQRERLRFAKPGEIQAEMFAKALDAVQKNVLVLREIQAEIPFQVFDIPGYFSAPFCRSA